MITREGNLYRVKGSVTIDNVTAVLEQGITLFDQENLTVDMSSLEEVDSSAVSMMLEWLREAQRRKQRLSFINLPENLKSLTKLYGVAELIPSENT